MKEAHRVLAVHDSLRAKNQRVVCVEGHTAEEHNETADYFVKIATKLAPSLCPRAEQSMETSDLWRTSAPRPTRSVPKVKRQFKDMRAFTHSPSCPFAGPCRFA